MKIEKPNGEPISDWDDWASTYHGKKQRHWKEHRSAFSTARFILDCGGADYLLEKVSALTGEDVSFHRAVVEYEQRFDNLGHGREHDLGIFGSTKDGKSVFVGLEAKVDEPFGDLVSKAYLAAVTKRISGKNTNAPERIERLLQMHFPEPNSKIWDIRYQLLYATAGTLAAKADISVLYVLVFKTPLYTEDVGHANECDFHGFMKLAGATEFEGVGSARVYELILDEKKLFCVYEMVDLN